MNSAVASVISRADGGAYRGAGCKETAVLLLSHGFPRCRPGPENASWRPVWAGRRHRPVMCLGRSDSALLSLLAGLLAADKIIYATDPAALSTMVATARSSIAGGSSAERGRARRCHYQVRPWTGKHILANSNTTCRCHRSARRWCAPAAESLVPTLGRTGRKGRSVRV
jgi:hypothetical protein